MTNYGVLQSAMLSRCLCQHVPLISVDRHRDTSTASSAVPATLHVLDRPQMVRKCRRHVHLTVVYLFNNLNFFRFALGTFYSIK